MYVLELKGITKKFPHVVALDNVDFNLKISEVHAILGENGAGKSTLVNIISGIYQPDFGEIIFEGRKVFFNSPRDALRHGIVYFQQNPILSEQLTVFENLVIWLDEKPSKELRRRIENRLNEFEIKLDLDSKVYNLSISEKVRVELAKVVLRNGKIYIFDEPTSTIGLKDKELVYNIIRKLKSEGKSIIYITHKVDEVFEIADRVTVLRKGKKVFTKNVHEVTKSELINAMFEKTLSNEELKVETTKIDKSQVLLYIENVSIRDDVGKTIVRDVSLKIYPGEIVGIAGILGSGQKELFEAIVGLRKVEKGKIIFKGIDITNKSPKMIKELGISYIPDDRISIGTAQSLTVLHNLILRDLDKYIGLIKLSDKELKNELLQVLKIVNLPENIIDIPCADLSGGTIQKIILAREVFIRNTQLLIALYPTRGLDYETTKFIHSIFKQLKLNNCSVLFASEDINEIVSLSDRILVMCNGKIVQEFTRENLDINKIFELLIT